MTGDGLPHYPSTADAERGCGCLIAAGLASLAFWGIVLVVWGPLAALGILLILIALFGFAVSA